MSGRDEQRDRGLGSAVGLLADAWEHVTAIEVDCGGMGKAFAVNLSAKLGKPVRVAPKRPLLTENMNPNRKDDDHAM